MQSTDHILTKTGILTTFSISKKIDEKEVSSFFKKYKKSGKSNVEIGELLKKKIFEDIKDAVQNQKIPGIIIPQGLPTSVNEKINNAVGELNKFIMIVASKLSEKKYDKMSLCYFINSLVNGLGLTEEDFESFHRKMSQQNEDNDENA